MKKILFVLAVFFSTYSFACDDASFTFQSEVDNGDGTYTYTFDVCLEMLGLEGIPDWFQVQFSGGTFVDVDDNAWSPDIISTSGGDDYNGTRRNSNSSVRWIVGGVFPAHGSNLLCQSGITVTTNGRPANIDVNFHDTYPSGDCYFTYAVYTPDPCDGLTAVPTVTTTQPTCAVPTGTIEFDAQANVEYSVDGGSNYQASTTFAGLAPGDYDLDVRSTTNGTCTTAGVTITIDPVPSAPSVPTATVTQPTCAVPTGTIVFDAQAGVEYGLDGAYQVSATFSGLAAATYTLSVRSTSDNTCETNAASTETINAAPSAPSVPTATVTQPTCAVPTGTIVFDAQAGVEYALDGLYQASPTFAGLASGTYTLSVRSTADNTCETNAASTITINAVPSAPSVPTASETQPTCAVPTGTIVFDAQAGVEYALDGVYQASETFAGLAPGTYTLSVRSTGDNTCETNAASTITINAVPSAPAVPTAVSTDPTCGTPTGSIVFNAQAGVEYALDGVYQVSPTFSGLAPATYTLSVRSTTDNTCETNAAATITINPAAGAPATPTYTITQPTCLVPTGSIVFDTQVNAEYSVDAGGAYQASETFTGFAPGATIDLAVRSTVDNSCETLGATITFDNPPNMTISIDAITHVACFGESTGSATLSNDGVDPTTYNWLGPVNFTGNPGINLPAGSYVVSATDVNGCAGTLNVDINDAPSQLYANSTVVNTSCGFANGEITLNPFGGNGGPYDVLWTDLSTDNPRQNLADGSYDVSVTDAGGCQLDTTINIGASGNITVDVINPVDATCFAYSDGSLEMSTNGALPLTSILWDDANTQSTAIATNLQEGTYEVTVVDANGCTGTAIGVVNHPDPLNIGFIVSDPDCGIPNGTITASPSGGTPGYTVDWPSLGFNDQLALTGIDVGVHSVMLTDAAGCILNTTVLLENPGPPDVAILSITNNDCFGEFNGAATVEATDGVGPYSFIWTDDQGIPNGLMGETVTGLPAGDYFVFAVDQNNCFDGELISITSPSSPLIASAQGVSSTCGDSNGEVNATAFGGTEPYTFTLNGSPQATGSFTGLAAGTHSLQISDVNGCSDDLTVAISNSDGPTLDQIDIEGPECFGGTDGSAYVLVQGGVPGYTFYHEGTETNADIYDLAAGENQVLVVDAQLCSLYVDFTVPTPDEIIAVIDTTSLPDDLPEPLEANADNSIGASQFVWDLNGVEVSSSSSMSEMIFDEGAYELILTASEGNCLDRDTMNFDFTKEFDFNIPSTFTPNDDGTNDNFTLVNTHYEFVKVQIFNRWGVMVYTYTGTNFNWDGRLKSGTKASDGTYFYILTYGDNETSNLSEVNGYVELMR